MKYENETKTKKDKIFGKVLAMYRKGCSNREIIQAVPDLPDFEVLNMIQKIFGQDYIKEHGTN